MVVLWVLGETWFQAPWLQADMMAHCQAARQVKGTGCEGKDETLHMFQHDTSLLAISAMLFSLELGTLHRRVSGEARKAQPA